MLLCPSQNSSGTGARRGGFTLVELLVVMSIILILAGIVIGVQRGVYRKQSEAKARGEMQAIATALESFKLKYGDYPWTGSDQPEQLFNALTGASKLYVENDKVYMGIPDGGSTHAGFLEASKMTVDSKDDPTKFMDPWGNEYHYYYKSTDDSDNYRDGNTSNDPWQFPGFVLLSEGPDGSMSSDGETNGTLPTNAEEYYLNGNAKNQDNIVHGLEL